MLLTNAVVRRVLQLVKRRFNEFPDCGQVIHCAVTGAGGDQHGDRRAAVLRKTNRTLGPLDGFVYRDEWRLQQDKGAQSHVIPRDEVCGITKLVERHPLVEFFERLRVDCLKAKRDLELAAQPVAKLEATIPDQGRVTLDDDPVKIDQARSYRGILGLGNRLAVEETSGVVQLDLAQLGQAATLTFRLAKRKVNLPGDRPGEPGFVERVLPEIAHQAAPRAFPVGKEDRQPIDEAAVGVALLFEQPGVGAVWVETVL